MPNKLKVLTFGWEFPPHISGGLGTACYGLTKSLLKQGTEVLFVVPRARGDEEIPMISASDIFIPRDQTPEAMLSEETTSVYSLSGAREMKVLTVLSEIEPYSAPQISLSSDIEAWNYEITERSGGFPAVPAIRYRFTGTYGPHLLEEVRRYGEVGGAIGLQNDFDVIHAHDWLTFPAGVAAKRASSKPLVIHVHSTEYDRAGSHNVDNRVLEIERQGMEDADLIVAVSEWTKQILISKYGVKRAKIAVVHNGVMAGKRTGAHTQPLRIARNMVTFLGRITYQKGPHYFVEAARKVLEKFPDTHFVVAGSGDLLPAIVERVAALKLSTRFHFTGFLRSEQVNQVWALSDVYVMPSVSEPFGIAPLEAIQSGVPVIVSNQSGVSEVIHHAIKADFWDIDALAGAICSVLTHKSLVKTLRKHSKEQLKEISWDNAARKLIKLFHETRSKNN